MYYVYMLQDLDKKIYLGYSSDLKRRITAHESGTTHTTSRMKKPKLIYYESFSTEQLAREREGKLKQFGSSYTGLLKRLGLK